MLYDCQAGTVFECSRNEEVPVCLFPGLSNKDVTRSYQARVCVDHTTDNSIFSSARVSQVKLTVNSECYVSKGEFNHVLILVLRSAQQAQEMQKLKVEFDIP